MRISSAVRRSYDIGWYLHLCDIDLLCVWRFHLYGLDVSLACMLPSFNLIIHVRVHNPIEFHDIVMRCPLFFHVIYSLGTATRSSNSCTVGG